MCGFDAHPEDHPRLEEFGRLASFRPRNIWVRLPESLPKFHAGEDERLVSSPTNYAALVQLQPPVPFFGAQAEMARHSTFNRDLRSSILRRSTTFE